MREKIIQNFIILLMPIGLFLVSDPRAAASQSQSLSKDIRTQWEASAHAGSGDSPEEMKRMNTPECARCHTAQGFWEVVLEGKPSSAPYENPTGLSCISGHFPGKDESKIGILRVTDTRNACTGCHDLIVKSTAEELSWCPQGSILNGKGGSEFEGKDYPSGAHIRLKKNCVSCHMAEAPEGFDNIVGGHTFRVITKGSTPRALNTYACSQCHDAIILDWVEMSQAQIKRLLEELASILPKRTFQSEGVKKEEAKFPKDPSLNAVESQASFNYWMIVKDGTFGVHNPVYIKKLLEDSIEALKNLKN
ncbi:MAG: hypothetical protein ABIL68_11615 [bacterium]